MPRLFFSPFGITHPLGLPRPISPGNLFGAKLPYFAFNLMPVPTGCLAHFDGAVYEPYMKRLVASLALREFGWTGPVVMDDPARYCLLRDGEPSEIPVDLIPFLPPPPRVALETVLSYFGEARGSVSPLHLLDVLTLIREDIGAVKFASVAAAHPWVSEFMR
jgi:hypothetical protein